MFRRKYQKNIVSLHLMMEDLYETLIPQLSA